MATPDAVLAAAPSLAYTGRAITYLRQLAGSIEHGDPIVIAAEAPALFRAAADAYLAAEAECERLTAELTRAIADLRGTEDNSDNLIGQSLIWIGGDEGEAWQDEFAAWYQPKQWPLGMHRAMNAFLAGKVRDYRAALARRDHPTAEPEE